MKGSLRCECDKVNRGVLFQECTPIAEILAREGLTTFADVVAVARDGLQVRWGARLIVTQLSVSRMLQLPASVVRCTQAATQVKRTAVNKHWCGCVNSSKSSYATGIKVTFFESISLIWLGSGWV